jgi:hypothetical protein
MMTRVDQLFAEAKAASRYLRTIGTVSAGVAPSAPAGQLSVDETAKVEAELATLQVQAKSSSLTSVERGRLAVRMLALRQKITPGGLPPLPRRQR